MDIDRLNSELSSIALSISAVAVVIWLSVSGAFLKLPSDQAKNAPPIEKVYTKYHSIIPDHYLLPLHRKTIATTTRTTDQLALANDYFQLGMAYYHGIDYEKDDMTARQWFTKGAIRGDRNARSHLAMMLLMGYGGDQDIEQATYWLDLSK